MTSDLSDDDLIFKNIKSSYGKHIPNYFISNIKNTYENTKHHHFQLQDTQLIYRIILHSLPLRYISKSGIQVGDLGFSLCKDPFEHGIIEKSILLLEKQYFGAILLLLGGSYRPIMPILRYMIQITTWVAASILDRKSLTGNLEDVGKAMSEFEFEAFLKFNNDSFSKNKKTDFKPRQGVANIPFKFISKLPYKYKNEGGMRAIRRLYGDLSGYAHPNVLDNIRTDKNKYGRYGLGKTNFA